MHSELGPKSRMDVLWKFSRRKYTIQEFINTPNLPCLTANWNSSSACVCARGCVRVHLSSHPFLLQTYISPPVHHVFGPHWAVWLFITEAIWQWSLRREQALQTKIIRKSTLSSCYPFMVFLIHLTLYKARWRLLTHSAAHALWSWPPFPVLFSVMQGLGGKVWQVF